MTTLSEAVEQFLTLRATKHSKGTARGDDQTLRKLLAYTGNIRMAALTVDHLTGFFYDADRGLVHYVAPGTFNVHLTRMRVFLRWTKTRRYTKLGVDLLADIDRRVTDDAPERQRLTPKEIKAGANVAQTPRDRFLWMLTACTGLRTISVQSLTVGQVDRQQVRGWLRNVKVKGGKYITLPISDDLAPEIDRWFATYAKECGILQSHWYAVPRAHKVGYISTPEGRINSGARGYVPTLHVAQPVVVVKRTLAMLGKDGMGEGMHTLRRSGARILFDALVDEGDARAIHTVREFLGHKNVAMTEHYIGTNVEKQRLSEALHGRSLMGDDIEPSNVSDLSAAREKRESGA